LGVDLPHTHRMLAVVFVAAVALGDGLRGVSPSKQSLYDSSKPFTCFDGASIPHFVLPFPAHKSVHSSLTHSHRSRALL
jgi:hypothetical protein